MKKRPRLAFFLIVLFQVLVLVGMIAFNEIALANGQTVILQTGPVDPFDIFRGDYVALRYDISNPVDIPGTNTLDARDTAYVRLVQNGDVWVAAEVTDDAGVAGNWETYIAGEVNFASGNRADIQYGIEQYFVEEGVGLVIQNARDIKVRVRLSTSGRPYIENLIVDGEIY